MSFLATFFILLHSMGKLPVFFTNRKNCHIQNVFKKFESCGASFHRTRIALEKIRNFIQKITIQTTGNASDFGDLTNIKYGGAAFSGGA